MSIIAAGTAVPEFSLKREDFTDFTREDLLGHTTVLVFYPFAFSPVCTDQMQIYEEALEDFAAQGATLYGVSTDRVWSQKAFKEKLGVTHRAALGLRAQGRGVAGLRRLLRARRHDQPRAGHRRPRRRRALEPPRRLARATSPGVGLIFDGLAAAPVS